MKRVSEKFLEFDRGLIRELTEAPSTNRRQIETARKALGDVIREDLTPRQREIITLHYYQNLSLKAIAQELSLDPSTVSRTLKRAKANIHHSLRLYFKYLYSCQEED